MLRVGSALVFSALCLFAAMPADARGPRAAAEKQSRNRVAHAQEIIVLSGIDRPRRGRALPLLSDRMQRAPEDRAVDLRAAPSRSLMLRSVPLHERIDVGVGLFAVTGATVKERELRRTDPMRDVSPRTSRVAGAGLRVNF